MLLVGSYDALTLAVRSDKHFCFAKNAFECLLIIDKHIASRATQEEFYSRCKAAVYLTKQVRIIISSTKEEAIVCPARLFASAHLILPSLYACGRWLSIGHIHKRGYTTCDSGLTLALYARLVRKTGLTEMHLVINSTGEKPQATAINDICSLKNRLRDILTLIYRRYESPINQDRADKRSAFIGDSRLTKECL